MEIKKICLLGAGTIGSQISQLAASSGFIVSMIDIEDRFVQSGLNSIKGSLSKFYVDKGKMTQEEADAVLDRIKGTVDLREAVKNAQVVIECIPEVMELKQQAFKELDEICDPETILVSNTSSLSLTAIGSLTNRQDKVIGMHFFNPVTVLRFIEIVRGAKTSDETYETAKALAQKFGDDTVTVGDSPGFITSRLFTVLINEAAKIVSEGIASPEDVDKACQLGLGHAMGPLASADLGIEVVFHTLKYLREELGDSYKPCQLLTKKVLSGELGRKTGRGFYNYSQ